MSEITEADLGDEYWATSDGVQDEFTLTTSGQEPDHESRIQKATRMVQADWSDATGGIIPDDLPDITAAQNALLRDATAYLAASLAHLKFAQNVSGDNNGDQRHVFLESKSSQAFDKWTSVAEVKPDDDTDDSGTDIGGVTGTMFSGNRNPIERGGGR